MRIGPARALLLSFLLLLAPFVRAADDKEQKDQGKKPKLTPEQMEKAIEQIEIEYNAIKSSQDLEPSRRRRILADRLSQYPHKDARKLLVRIVMEDRDLRAQIVAMNSLALIGDLASIKKMFSYILKKQRTVLPDYLGPALMKATDPAVGPWIVKKVLKHPNKILRMSAVEALGALRTKEAREPLLELYAKLRGKLDKGSQSSSGNEKLMHLFYEVVRSLGQIGGEGVKEILYASANDEDWRVRLAAAEVLTVRFRDKETLGLQRKLLKDEKPIVREVAGVAAGEHNLEPLFPELILLMREGNLRSKHKAYVAMRQISGKDYKYAPDAWQKWWDDKKAGKLTKDGDIKAKETVSIATYYNFKIFSDRLLFVIDVSGSMKWPDYHPNRIEVAHRELKKAILSLNDKTLFNVATFAGHVQFWKKGEVPATKKNIDEALSWVQSSLLPRGATNTYAALIESLEKNPLVDTIYFLSDGIPSTGHFEIPEEILIKLRDANRYRKVIFNTIALAFGKASIEKAQKYEDPDEMAAFMSMIAELTGGTCLDIRKPFLDR